MSLMNLFWFRFGVYSAMTVIWFVWFCLERKQFFGVMALAFAILATVSFWRIREEKMKTFQDMQSEFYADARRELLAGLSRCTDAQVLLFKRMYANGDLDAPIDKVVEKMENDKLDWAMQQVQRTIEKGNR
jgi:hypothetical protein